MKRFMKWTLIALGLVALFALGSGPLFSHQMEFIAFGTVASASTIGAMIKNFNVLFNEAQAAQTPAWPSYAMKVNSEGASEDYIWLGDTPAMREWLGEKFLKDMRGYNYHVPNKDFEATVKVKRTDIEDDRLGRYSILIPGLADEGTVKQDSLLIDLRIAGTTNDIYDGKKFYAANHVTGKSGTQSNLLTGTGHTLAQVGVDLVSARTALRRFMTDQDKPFIRESGKLKLQIQCPPDLEFIFETLRNSKTISASDNTLFQAFEYQVSQYLSDTDDWYIDYVGARVRPFVLQMRKEPHLVVADDPKSETMFLRAEYLFSNEARFAAAYGLWPYSIKVSNA